MISRLIILLLIVGCIPKTVTLNYDKIKADCNIECKRFVISSNEWFEVMREMGHTNTQTTMQYLRFPLQ